MVRLRRPRRLLASGTQGWAQSIKYELRRTRTATEPSNASVRTKKGCLTCKARRVAAHDTSVKLASPNSSRPVGRNDSEKTIGIIFENHTPDGKLKLPGRRVFIRVPQKANDTNICTAILPLGRFHCSAGSLYSGSIDLWRLPFQQSQSFFPNLPLCDLASFREHKS